MKLIGDKLIFSKVTSFLKHFQKKLRLTLFGQIVFKKIITFLSFTNE